MRWNPPRKSFGRFVNPYVESPKHNLWDVVLWRFGHYDEPHTLPPDDFVYPASPQQFVSGCPSAVWIGHSTFLIEIGGLHILTDPLFSNHCSPIPIESLQRRFQPFISMENLPPIDLILISHNHYDHLDDRSVGRLNRQFPKAQWLVPFGVKRWLMKRNISAVAELHWGEAFSFGDRARITAVPAQHFSGRGLWDENRSLWCGFVFEAGAKRFYFVGDSGYNEIDFKKIGEKWGPIDLSLIPIGAYAPKRLMQSIHVSPYEAVQIHSDVKSRLSLGMHWNTFVLSDEPVNLPPYDLFLAMEQNHLPFETFLPVEIGEYVNW